MFVSVSVCVPESVEMMFFTTALHYHIVNPMKIRRRTVYTGNLYADNITHWNCHNFLPLSFTILAFFLYCVCKVHQPLCGLSDAFLMFPIVCRRREMIASLTCQISEECPCPISCRIRTLRNLIILLLVIVLLVEVPPNFSLPKSSNFSLCISISNYG